MKKLNSEIKLCLMCMEEHEVYLVKEMNTVVFKDREIDYLAKYEYCEQADQLMEDEELLKSNKLAMIDQYRSEVGLLTSGEISQIRSKYSISQKDFSQVLDWGKATITRYENHQVQDRAHDDILRLADSDPKWFLHKLSMAKERLSLKAFKKYFSLAHNLYLEKVDFYIREAIEADYSQNTEPMLNGNQFLDIDKVVDIINYFALKIESLHKVKLMKLLWYADNLSFKRKGYSITGLMYISFPMGALPLSHEKLVALKSVEVEEVRYENFDYLAQKFSPVENFKIQFLSCDDVEVLNTVIEELGQLGTKHIVERMHDEDGYKFTKADDMISYKYSKNLSIE